MTTINRRLKAWVRYDGMGRIIAGGPIYAIHAPKVGKWKEIQANLCCNPITTTSTSTSTSTSTTTFIPTTCTTLGRAGNFAILGHETVTSTGSTVVNGDLGLSPGTSVTGFPPGTVHGTKHITDTAAANGIIDAQAAHNCLSALTPTGHADADIGGQTFSPGVYTVDSSLGITGTVTLDGGGNPNAIFVFVIGSTFIPAGSAIVALTGETQPCNVWWIVGSSATLSISSTTVGNIIAVSSVTFNTNATLTGRAIALTGAVTMDTNVITGCNCTIDPCTNPPTTSTTSSTTTSTPQGLVLTFDNITNANTLIGGSSSTVSLWNTFFDLPTKGSVFTSVVVVGNVVNLYGGSGITLKDSLFVSNVSLLQFNDNVGCIINIGTVSLAACSNLTLFNCPAVTIINDYACQSSTSLTSINLPIATTVGKNCFQICTSLINIYLPLCTQLGPTVGDDLVFSGITGKTITLTIPLALMTCNVGAPDGDIQYLQANNTVTVITV